MAKSAIFLYVSDFFWVGGILKLMSVKSDVVLLIWEPFGFLMGVEKCSLNIFHVLFDWL